MKSINEIKKILADSKTKIAADFGVSEISIFGSYSRDEQNEKSDVDILVDFSRPIGLEFVKLADYLEKIIGIKTHVVSKGALKKNIKQLIEEELVHV
jgi:predicted nucleotidyltransferase